MEIAGLGVGVVALAGAFKDVIDIFSLIRASQDIGRDYEILDAKLDIEKTCLLQWADRVRLLKLEYDKRLDHPTTAASVDRTLACMRMLLTESSSLQQRYELCDDSLQASGNSQVQVFGGDRMADFSRRFESFKIRLDRRTAASSLPNRVRWVIRDKQKFENLVKELSYFTEKLNLLVPDKSGQLTAQFMAMTDVEAVETIEQLGLVVQASLGHKNTIAEEAQREIRKRQEDRVLDPLWFRAMDDRKQIVADAHFKTLHWALQAPDNDDAMWSNLVEWLESGTGIYWISGKAGSGKSTLMKFLYAQERTKELLAAWAGEDTCVLASHFFWHLGTTAEQKSQEGLLRALLYQVLAARRSLIPQLLPNLWLEAQKMEEGHELDLPSRAELTSAFHALRKADAPDMGKFCFFIDGLDEFDGDYIDGIKFIQGLTAGNSRIKILVSSRPIPSCVAAFSQTPNLRLQDLTRADIEAYVDDVIGGHEYMTRLIDRHKSEAEILLRDLIDKSSGVFLWVVLACRSLVSGFADYDNITELSRRIDDLPPELENMFQHMLRKIHKRHREYGAKLLRLCHAVNVQGLQNRNEVKDFSTFGLALVDEHLATNGHPPTSGGFESPLLSAEQKVELCKQVAGRLASRCGGLLETTRLRRGGRDFEVGHQGAIINVGQDAALVNGEIVFMHRTVFEFLCAKDSWDLECLAIDDDEFDTNTTLWNISLHLAMQSLHLKLPFEIQAHQFLREALEWAALADLNGFSDRTIFSNLQPFFTLVAGYEPHRPFLHNLLGLHSHATDHASSHAGLCLAIEAGAVNYVATQPEIQTLVSSPVPSCGCLPPLFTAVCRNFLYAGSTTQGDPYCNFSKDMARLLLVDLKCNPNADISDQQWDAANIYSNPSTLAPLYGAEFRSHREANQSRNLGSTFDPSLSPWETWLRFMGSDRLHLDSKRLEVAEVTEMFLEAGAKTTRMDVKSCIKTGILGEKPSGQMRKRVAALLRVIEKTENRR